MSKAKPYSGFVNSKGVEAPAVESNVTELGDTRLSPQEGVIKLREKCLSMAAKKKIGNQAELEDPERSSGPRLQFTELISRLRRIVPDLKVVDGSAGNIALYFPRNRKELKTATTEWDQSEGRDIFFLRHKYVGGFPKQDIPEFAIVDLDTSHLPTREGWMVGDKFVAGHSWRSTLISLLKQGLLSYSAAVNEFGDVGTDRRGSRWLKETRKWRNEPHTKFASTSAPAETKEGVTNE